MKIFGIEKPIIGMIHADALQGTPNYKGDWKNSIEPNRVKQLMAKVNKLR